MAEPAGSGRSGTAVPVAKAQDTVAVPAISWRYGVVRAEGLRDERRALDDKVGLVGARGFEPPTSSSRTMRATKLRHAPTEGARLQGLRMIAHGGRTDTWRKETNGRPLDVGASATPIASRGRPAMRTLTNQLRVRSLA